MDRQMDIKNETDRMMARDRCLDKRQWQKETRQCFLLRVK